MVDWLVVVDVPGAVTPVVVVEGLATLVVVSIGSATGVHARIAMTETANAGLIPTGGIYSQFVFGPLNGVRLALVISAAVAALVAIFSGFTAAGLILLAGVALHGAGWLYLYSRRYPDTSE